MIKNFAIFEEKSTGAACALVRYESGAMREFFAENLLCLPNSLHKAYTSGEFVVVRERDGIVRSGKWYERK